MSGFTLDEAFKALNNKKKLTESLKEYTTNDYWKKFEEDPYIFPIPDEYLLQDLLHLGYSQSDGLPTDPDGIFDDYVVDSYKAWDDLFGNYGYIPYYPVKIYVGNNKEAVGCKLNNDEYAARFHAGRTGNTFSEIYKTLDELEDALN